MTTLAELRTTVRRALADFPKTQIDTATYDGSSNPLPTGKDLPIETNSETFTVAGVTQVRGTNYTIDFDARQLTLVGTLPGAGTALRLQYKECVYKTEQIDEALNQGRSLLFPTIYKKGVVSVTMRNLVRDYDLATTDCNEPAMRSVFAQGHMEYKILRAYYLPNGSNDQQYIPFRRFWQQGESVIHLWDLLPAAYTLYLEVAYAFTPLTDASQTSDIPRLAQPLVTEWAISALALKQEPVRNRIDTANVLQGPYANPPGAQAQTSEDFLRRVEYIRRFLNIEPMVFELRDMPRSWQAGVAG